MAALLLVLVAFTKVAWAEPPDLEVSVIPSSVEVPPLGEASALVVVQNTGQDALHNVKLSWFSDAGVELVVEEPMSSTLVAYGILVWRIRVTQMEGMQVEGTVHLRVDYTWEEDAATEPVPRASFGSLQVAARQPETVERVVEVQAMTTGQSLMEHRPVLDYLVVTNISDVPIRVTEVLSSGPAFIQFESPGIGDGLILAPHEKGTIAIQAKATDVAQPGKYLLLYEVTLEWKGEGLERTGKVITTREISVGVLGESEILTILGIPSLLVLPGFLMIVTYKILWGRGKSKDEKNRFPLEIKAPEFWVVAVLLSILTSLLYPMVTGWYGTPRNYLQGYGLSDIASLWLISVIVAIMAYIFTQGVINLYRRYRTWRVQRLMPSANDGPIVILRKLHRQNLGLILERVDIKVQGESQRAYVLIPRDDDRELIWVGPSIVLKWLGATDRKEQQRTEELREKVLGQLGPKGSAIALVKLMMQGHRKGVLRVTWKRMGKVDRPREVKKEEIVDYLTASLIIEQE